MASATDQIKKSFNSTLGILGAVLVFIAVLAALGFSFAFAHDFIVSRTYEAHPAIAKDNAWGPLLVSVNITQKTKTDGTPATTVSCYVSPDTALGRLLGRSATTGQSTSDPNCTTTVPATPGESHLAGTIRIKNRLWLSSVRISADILKAQFGADVTSTDSPGLDGRILNPGEGLSKDFTASFGAGRDGAVALTHDGKATAVK